MTWLNDMNLLISVMAGAVGIYAGYHKAMADAENKAGSNAEIITMLKNQQVLLEKLEAKVEKTTSDRVLIEKELARHDEQIRTLFEFKKEREKRKNDE